MRTIMIAAFSVLTLAACAAQPGPTRSLTLGTDEFSYRTAIGPPSSARSSGGALGFLSAAPGLDIFIIARNGARVSEADRPAAIAAAQAICRENGLQFNDRTRGTWRAEGELSFGGDCMPWP